jgi:polysaccharide pyruvyl transferase WcaK-like protein
VAITHLEIVTLESPPSIGDEARPTCIATNAAAHIDETGLWRGLNECHWCRTIKTVNVGDLVLRDGRAATACIWRIVEELPGVRAMTVRVTDMQDVRDLHAIVELGHACQHKQVQFSCDFVLDADADAGATLSDRPNSLAWIRRASRDLQHQGIRVRWLIPLCPALVFRLEGLFSQARVDQCDPVLVQSDALWSNGKCPLTDLNSAQAIFAWDFITYRLLDEDRHFYSQPRLQYYQSLQLALASTGRLSPAKQRLDAVLAVDIGESGKVVSWRSFESPSRAALQEDLHLDEHKHSLRRNGGNVVMHALDIARVLRHGLLAVGQWSCAQFASASIGSADEIPASLIKNVAVIGAYGGEHIGDTAILGGVLTRIRQRHGVTRAVLMSQRPAHTRHLVDMLDVPVEISVEPYEHASIRKCLDTVDAVVFAGGPLMDLPKQLVRHLYMVSLATRMQKPFFVEGIGSGPFVSKSSQWVARRLVQMSQRISVRTSDDAIHPLMRGLEPEVGRDPAFDYLQTRSASLSRLTAHDRIWIEKLLQGVQGRTLVGINIRPIRQKFTEMAGRQDRTEHTRRMESRFEQRLAEGLRRFASESAIEPRFIFFPMNAIQFGQSDLRSAYRIKRLLGSGVDFQIWEADASLDGVVALMRRLDVVVAMRFHAAIFALSQGRPVIGIDYRVGKRDKVAALLSDFDQYKNCARIDEMSPDWLCERLTALSGSPKAIAAVGRTEELHADEV